MSWTRFLSRIRGLVRATARRADLDAEIRAHIAEIEDGYRAAGLPVDDARTAAHRTFGSAAFAREQSEDMWRLRWLDDLGRDVTFGLRMVRRHLRLSLVILTILAVSIGSSTAVYSLVDACLWHSPVSDRPVHDRWVAIRARLADQSYSHFFSVPELADVKGLTDVFENVGAVAGSSFSMSEGDFPERVLGTRITANMITMLGTPPLLGRTFRADEDRPGGNSVAVLSYNFWEQRFAGDPSVLGREISLDSRPYTVIGVMPAHFDLWGGQVWLPWQLDMSNPDRQARRFWITAVTRPGLSEREVNTRLRLLARELARDHIAERPDYATLDLRVWNIREAVVGGVKTSFLVLLAAVGLLLVTACANVANLLLARATTRSRELQIRVALGAGRGRLIRQMLTETLLLSFTGGSLGVTVAAWILPALVNMIPPEYLTTDAELVRINWQVAAVAAVASIVSGLIFGLVPALRAGRTRGAAGADGLRQRAGGGDRRTRTAQGGLTVAQIALTMVVTIAAALTVQGYAAAQRLWLGFNTDGVLSFYVALPQTYTTPRQLAAFHRAALAELSRAGVLPAGSAAAAVTERPLGYRTVDIRAFEVDIVGRPVRDAAPLPTAAFRLVSSDYFSVMQTPLVAGRSLAAADDEAHPLVAVVNQAMARRFWDAATPIGAQVRLGARVGQRDPLAPERGDLVTIVGVVADSRQTRVIDAPVRPELFLPMAQHAPESRTMAYVVRTPADPASAAAAIRAAVKRVDPAQPIYGVETMADVAADAFGPKRLTTLLLGFFAVVTISLSAVGLYAVVSFGVTQRAQEIGVRLAVGASPGAVVRLVAARGARLAAVGVAIGAAVALAITRFMSSELTNVSASDPWVFAISATMLLAVALAAALAPARRATRVDPLAVLRHE